MEIQSKSNNTEEYNKSNQNIKENESNKKENIDVDTIEKEHESNKKENIDVDTIEKEHESNKNENIDVDSTEKEHIDSDSITHDISKEGNNSNKGDNSEEKDKENVKDNSSETTNNLNFLKKDDNEDQESYNETPLDSNNNIQLNNENSTVKENTSEFSKSTFNLDEMLTPIHNKYKDDVKDHVGEYEIIKNEFGLNIYHCLNKKTYTFCEKPVNGEEGLGTLFNEIDNKLNAVMKTERLSNAVNPKLIDAEDQSTTGIIDTNGNIKDKNEKKNITDNKNDKDKNKKDRQKVVKNNYYDNYNYSNENKGKEEDIIVGYNNDRNRGIITEDKPNNINTINTGNNINNGKRYKSSKSYDNNKIITWALISGLFTIMVISLFFWKRNRRRYSESNSTKTSNNTEKGNPSIPKKLISKNKLNFKTIQMDTLSIDDENSFYTPNTSYSRVINIDKY